MVPLVVLALVAVAVVVSVLAVASGRLPVDPLADAVHTTPDAGLPLTPVAADVDTVRFDTALRGYRMDDVDARLDELRDTLAERERTLLDLGGSLTEPRPVPAEWRQVPAEPRPVPAERRPVPAEPEQGGAPLPPPPGD